MGSDWRRNERLRAVPVGGRYGQALGRPERCVLELRGEDPGGRGWRAPAGGDSRFLERNDSQDPVLSEPVFEHDRRFTEGRLDPGEDVYVLETAKAGPAEHVPADAVEPYVGTDRIEEGSGNVKTSLDWSLLPLAPGDPNESTPFAVADTKRRGAQRRLLTKGG